MTVRHEKMRIAGELVDGDTGNNIEVLLVDGDTAAVLKAAAVMRLPPEAGDQRTRLWNERYWIPVLLMLLLLLPQFRALMRRRAGS